MIAITLLAKRFILLRLKILVLSIISLFIFNSCATIFTGMTDTIHITSKPEGAKIYIDGYDYGRTPKDVTVQRRIFSSYVRLKKDGYETQHFVLRQQFNIITVLNFFFPPFFAVDAVSGAMFMYNPTYYEIELDPEK